MVTRSVFIALILAAAARPESGSLRQKLELIDQIISIEMSRQSIPGLSVAIAAGGKLRWSAGYGMADLENFVPVKASTVFRLASISKPLTAVAALQLYEQGKLDLDAPAQAYVPGFPEKEWTVTARHLLSHQAGIRHYKRYEGDNREYRHFSSLSQALPKFQDDPLLFEPGSKRVYTTYGYVLLGAIVEGASGQSYMDYLKSSVFRPAGMMTIRDDNVYDIIPNRSRWYRRTKDGVVVNSDYSDLSYKIPGGGLVSTSADLVRFALAFDNGKLLDASTMRLMLTPQKLSDGTVTASGLGWNRVEIDGRIWWGHSGGQQGATTDLLFLPGEGIAIAVMMNLEGAQRFTSRIAKILLEP